MGKQGLFFQLRHAGVIGSQSIIRQLGGVVARLSIVAVVLAGLGYFGLTRYFSSESYKEKVTLGIQEAMGLESIKSEGFQRRGSSGTFHDIEMEGGPDSFFSQARIDGLSGAFDFLTGVNSRWKPKNLRMDRGEFEIKAGGDDKEMEAAFHSLVSSLDGSGFRSIKIDSLNFDWGYSKLSYGRVEGTNFRAELVDGVWNVTLTGGKFRQNWLRDFTIKSASLSIHSGGITVHSLNLSKDRANLALSGKITGPVGKPQFDLAGPFQHLAIENVLDLKGIPIREYLFGTFSGSLDITGSTDTRIMVRGNAKVGGEDVLTLRERWPILRAISVLDINRSYRRLDFKEGGFAFKTSDGGVELSEIELHAGDSARLVGTLISRLPDQKEAAESLGIILTEGFVGSFDDDFTDTSAARKLEEARMSLNGATGGGGRVVDFEVGGEPSEPASTRRNPSMDPKELESLRLLEEMNVHRMSGLLRLAVPGDALASYGSLDNLYPVDPEGWRWIDIEVAGTFSNISTQAHDKILAASLVKDRVSNPE